MYFSFEALSGTVSVCSEFDLVTLEFSDTLGNYFKY